MLVHHILLSQNNIFKATSILHIFQEESKVKPFHSRAAVMYTVGMYTAVMYTVGMYTVVMYTAVMYTVGMQLY